MKRGIILIFLSALAAGCLHAPCTAPGLVPGNPLTGLAELKAGQAMRASSSDPNWVNGNGDARPIAPGGTLVLGDLKGPGVITHFWNTIAANERAYSRLLVLRIYWDGEEKPSVEAPIGDFFAIGHGVDQPFQSLPVTVTSDGRGRNCYWPMPFGKSAKVTVTNEGRKPIGAFYYYLDWEKLPALPKNTAYFHAMYRQEFPAIMGRNYLIADLEGRGHYVGTVLSVRQHLASWWGEGDDFWFIDGETTPSLRGTGSEDYFCDGWGFRQMSTPYYGAPLMQGNNPGDMTTVYRWHIADPVPFTKSLRLEIEHKGVTFNDDGSVKSGFEERADDFSSVAFWYQFEPHKPFAPLPAAYDRLYVDYGNIIEGEDFLNAAKASEGLVTTQDGGYSCGKQLWWCPTKEGQTLEFDVDAPKAGDYDLVTLLTSSWDYGVVQIEFDGKPVGAPVDTYNKTVVTNEKSLDVGKIAAGKHHIKFVNKGKNPESKGYLFGLDGLLFAQKTH